MLKQCETNKWYEQKWIKHLSLSCFPLTTSNSFKKRRPGSIKRWPWWGPPKWPKNIQTSTCDMSDAHSAWKKNSNCGKVDRILRLLGLALGLLTWVWISVFLTCPRMPLHLRLANNSPSHSQWRANDIRHVELKRVQWQYPYPLEPYNSMGQRQSNAIATRILRQHIKLNQWIQHGLTWDLLIQSASGVMLSLSLGGRAGPRKLGDCFNRGFLDEARWSNFPSSRWITLTTILDPQSDHLES